MMRPAILAATALFFVIAATTVDGQESEYSRRGADTCLSCHEDFRTLEIFKTKHANPADSRGPFGHGRLQCESCHGPGDAHSGRVRRGQERPAIPVFGATSTASIEEQNSTCMNCHNSDVGFGWHNGAHPSDEVACVDCHVSHAPVDPVLQTTTQPAVCFDCHQRQRSETRKAFSHPFFQGKMDCSGCHSAHGDQVATQLARQTVNATCEECHAEKRGPFLWEHAPVSEDCGLCHAPHGSNHSGMLTKRAPLLCQGCHSQSGHPSVAFSTDGLASGTPSQYLLGQGCMNCHSQVHGSNHPSGSKLQR
jgi:DmsE family decaheme c-type cytochrome